MFTRSNDAPSARKSARRLWQGASVALLVIAILRFGAFSLPTTLERTTPFDYTPLGDPALWHFIDESQARLPERTTVAVLTPGGEQDEVAYFFGVALLTRQRVVPNRYFGAPQSELQAAEYVLAYRDARIPDETFEVVETVAGGAIAARSQ